MFMDANQHLSQILIRFNLILYAQWDISTKGRTKHVHRAHRIVLNALTIKNAMSVQADIQ